MKKKKQLTLLSFGGGHDSTAILLLMIFDPEFRKRYAPGDLIVIMSDTGNEHPHTYSHVEQSKKLCEAHGIEFHLITTNYGMHTNSWPDLLTPQLRDEGEFKPTLVQMGMKTCTLNLKIGPIYKFLDEWVNEKYGYDFTVRPTRGCGKQALRKFVDENEQIKVLIGFAYGEEKRMNKSLKMEQKEVEKAAIAKEKGKRGEWGTAITRIFPLIDLGMGRDACVKLIDKHLDYEVMPSNCMLCPYQSGPELLWLYRNYPKMWKTWCLIEERKIARFKDVEGIKNHGVYNTKKLLPQKLEEAQKKHGHMTEGELHANKKYHGCDTNVF